MHVWLKKALVFSILLFVISLLSQSVRAQDVDQRSDYLEVVKKCNEENDTSAVCNRYRQQALIFSKNRLANTFEAFENRLNRLLGSSEIWDDAELSDLKILKADFYTFKKENLELVNEAETVGDVEIVVSNLQPAYSVLLNKLNSFIYKESLLKQKVVLDKIVSLIDVLEDTQATYSQEDKDRLADLSYRAQELMVNIDALLENHDNISSSSFNRDLTENTEDIDSLFDDLRELLNSLGYI
ncbi:hypothetical protein H6802_00840 [Candidatus Nomurabacteria bacterium]|uniref:Uncharacterized protein n=1 Tax=candidate division WWE3 bacterium TaxID=2053526 RepID=A0A955E0N1_UNCKA|nr:hypothetical protein [candidate division WWE3 bacterium]MCB9823490.1 hypothetical protein [Candidatus Nomurabacteria bacterium]MCB9827772.1 hypothetical protein [Candidatus Nomurabacteria bacterium]HXK52377.1 hypothetical protein [bacterium]